MNARLPSDAALRRTKDMRKLPIILVDWVDAASQGKWHEANPGRRETGTAQCQSVGFLVQRSAGKKPAFTISQNISETGNCSDVISIPWSTVVRVRVLRKL